MRNDTRRRAIWMAIALTIVAGTAAKCYGQELTAESVFKRYVEASGGENALGTVKSRQLVGKVVTAAGEAQLEIIEATPSHFLRIIDSPASGHSENGYDGTVAWSKNAGGIRDVKGPMVGVFARELDLQRPLTLRRAYASIGPPRADSLGGTAVIVLRAITADSVTETLYFSGRSGLLVGWDVDVGGTILRSRVNEYRRVDGLTIPFSITRSRPDFTWHEVILTVTNNVPVDAARFSKPAK